MTKLSNTSMIVVSAFFVTFGATSSRDQKETPAITAHAPFNFGISVHDAEATTQWYEANMGLKLRKTASYAHGKAIILGAGDAEVEIIQDDRAQDVGKGLSDYQKHGIFKIGFYVLDLDGVVTRLKKNNVHFYHDIFTDEELRLRSAIISDNDGNTIQLFEPVRDKGRESR